jgi:1-acyl-sn-glycerol-3-phosphate acyltransferase
LFWINIVFSVLIFGPATFLLGLISYDLCLFLSKQWCKYNLFFLKYICLLSYNFDGHEIKTSKIIISRHQSTWETFFFMAYIDYPIFILKKELLMIPLFGWCLYLLKHISIDRSDGVTSLKKIMKLSNEHIKKNRTLIIFPEGTRSPYGTKAKIRRGVFKILEFIKTKSYVVNHNAGKYWNNSFLIKPGRIKINVLSLEYDTNIDNLKNKIQKHFS